MGRKTGLYTYLVEALEEKPKESIRRIVMRTGVRAASIVARRLLGGRPGRAWFAILHGVMKYWFQKLRKWVEEYKTKGTKIKRLPTPEELAEEVLRNPEVIKSILEYAKKKYPAAYRILVEKLKAKGIAVPA